MAGFTPVYGWPYPGKNDQPAGQTQIRDLALATEADVNRIETVVIADILNRLTAVEAITAATRWREISSGTRGAGDFTLTVPAGFDRLRLHLLGDVDAAGDVNLRINNDVSSNHRFGFFSIDALGNLELPAFGNAVNEIQIARWSTTESNQATVDIYPTDGAQNPAVTAIGNIQSTDASSHSFRVGWGKLQADVVVSSLTIIDTTNFVSVRWWLEGHLA